MERLLHKTVLFLIKKKTALIAVFLFCLLCGYGYVRHMNDKTDEVLHSESYNFAPVAEDTQKSNTRKGRNKGTVVDEGVAGVKQKASYRSVYRGKPLQNPFTARMENKETREIEGLTEKNMNLPEVSKRKTDKSGANKNAGTHTRLPRVETYRLKGIIYGIEPLALISDGTRTEAYGKGAGPQGYEILQIDENGILWRGSRGEERISL